jgi:YbbR domain-containing protein
VANINYQQQYAESDDVSIKPSYVTLSGPGNVLEHIESWDTDSLTVDSVDETVRTNVDLLPSKEGNVSVFPKSVQVVVPVDEFTEKEISIPVKLANNHDYYKVKIFPQKVKVTFTTSLNRYAEMDEDLFEASADLNLWQNSGYTTLPVRLSRRPAYCKIVKIEPQNIDFIVRK